MSLAVLPASVLQTNGALSVGAAAQITVRTPASVLATLYTDRDGTTPTGNPVTADSAGFFRVYTTPGRYNITVTTVSGSQVYNDVVIEAEAEAKRNIAATDPAVTNDETEGYSEWSLWANSSTSEVFRCIDATEGAAVWVKTTLTIDELGTAALEDVGTAIGDVVQLEDVGGVAGLPAVDGSQLTGLASSGSGVTIATITPATDADVTLTQEQYTADVLLIETGEWTEARNIIAPDESRSWQVISNSTYAATVKTAAGTGVAVPAGQSRPLVCDGTNVVDPLDAYYDRAVIDSEVKIQSGTAVASTSGTAIDFTGIPSWAKRITVMFSGVSTNGTSQWLVQLGDSGGVEVTGYLGSADYFNNGAGNATVTAHTTGFGIFANAATRTIHGVMTIANISSSAWVASHSMADSSLAAVLTGGGSKTLSDTLDRIRITTVHGTDVFDAGTINIAWEG